jgi:glycosyltransferase involved in cell wall biosynthesis
MLIVVSAVNIFKGGSLTIAREFLRELSSARSKSANRDSITMFCHSAALYNDVHCEGVIFLERPLSRKNWLFRLYYEYIAFWFWSRGRDVDYWISLHDITPNVKAKHRFVYCHNPAPFYKGPRTWRYDVSFEMFRLFYHHLYRINIRNNDLVIVQQQWIREEFIRRYGLSKEMVLVALPENELKGGRHETAQLAPRSVITIIYPAIARPFKNFELLVRTMEVISSLPVKLVLTIGGQENRYARAIWGISKHMNNIEFAGYLNDESLRQLYEAATVMVFPSRLETWGLPMSEFKEYRKPIFAADLPYARETLQGYNQAFFFNPNDPRDLGKLLKRLWEGDLNYDGNGPRCIRYDTPFATSWEGLLRAMQLV